MLANTICLILHNFVFLATIDLFVLVHTEDFLGEILGWGREAIEPDGGVLAALNHGPHELLTAYLGSGDPLNI